MSLTSGTRLGAYETLALLGAGGMGEVYKARDTRLHRTVAIKVLPAHVAHDPEARERFEREARAVAALNHPHICTLHDIGEAATADSDEPMRFLVMEFVEGATINVVGDRPMAAERVADIGAQVCDALDAAHAVGIVHRDIKPLNIMLTPRGQVKVLDFGVAKLLPRFNADGADGAQPTDAATRTRTGLVMGTLAYMSPEQVCGDPVSSASDIFSLGSHSTADHRTPPVRARRGARSDASDGARAADPCTAASPPRQSIGAARVRGRDHANALEGSRPAAERVRRADGAAGSVRACPGRALTSADASCGPPHRGPAARADSDRAGVR
jgi:serine/threonine protein kinase